MTFFMSNALKTVKFLKLVWIMIGSPVCACDGRTKSLLLPGPSDAFYRYFNGNGEYERRFYSNSYNSYLGSGHGQQFKEMDSARQYSSIAGGAS